MLFDTPFLVLTLTGFGLMLAGIAIGQIAVVRMALMLNRSSSKSDNIPVWEAFFNPWKSGVIAKYRQGYTGGTLNRMLMLCWVMSGTGFVVVLLSHFAAK